MKRILAVLLLLCLAAGCGSAGNDAAEKKPKARQSGGSSQPASDREQVESEVREGGLKDPGGAKDVRQQSEEQQKEQQQEADQANQ